MKTLYQLPTGVLSYLKEIEVETQLTGEHFDQLTTATEESIEHTVLSILSGLTKADVYSLTQKEMYYVWLLVKIASLGGEIEDSIVCYNRVVKGEELDFCKHENEFHYNLGDSDLTYCPSDFKIPEIEYTHNGVKKTYLVRPPTMRAELDILTYFAEKSISRKDLADVENHKELTLEYTKHRIMTYLHDKETGESFSERGSRLAAVESMKGNPILFYKQALKCLKEVDQFGIKTTEQVITCKECGGTLRFHLPLLFGLLS